ncbi:hypothetical protein [Roseisolibacter agri]|uniref:Uncharacterized protein n=1 Tax=Roseisolibacter agri TaxID=2014610 RepID=A0AA37Q8J3_9BACT|nr:hypothetical protein [Roseisolibacter agri]GLC24291.1 hypothetical protein rosag_08040 [Roseisolibacter agri]
MSRDEQDADGDDETRGGSWLTYRYRLGGGRSDAHGTIKAPSFLSAARRLLERRLAPHVGDGTAYLRLRAAGEDEVLVRVTPSPDGRGAPRLETVPSDAFDFGEPDVSDDR